MRNNIFVIATILLLFGCSRTPSDARIERLLVGTWRLDQEPSRTVQNKPDGSYIVELVRGGSNVVAAGTWQVKAGFVIATVTNGAWFAAKGTVESNKVVSIDEQKATLISSLDGATRLTAHKQ